VAVLSHAEGGTRLGLDPFRRRRWLLLLVRFRPPLERNNDGFRDFWLNFDLVGFEVRTRSHFVFFLTAGGTYKFGKPIHVELMSIGLSGFNRRVRVPQQRLRPVSHGFWRMVLADAWAPTLACGGTCHRIRKQSPRVR